MKHLTGQFLNVELELKGVAVPAHSGPPPTKLVTPVRTSAVDTRAFEAALMPTGWVFPLSRFPFLFGFCFSLSLRQGLTGQL